MRTGLALIALFVGVGAPAWAACGPDALGTSRIVEVGAEGGLEVGLKSYPQTLPLEDHEVILTFDDGPEAASTPKILKALADECARATFFLIGRNAQGLARIARREALEGHTVAHHTWSHPILRFMPDAAARADILKGMIAVEKAAYGATFAGGEPRDLGEIKLHAPFFRFPGFADTKALRDWLAAGNVGVFGVDLWASDWIEMAPEEELKLVMSRLERNGRKGMLLFHDNHPWTAEMVPLLLRALKAKGYRVVHMVPGPVKPRTVPAPAGWSSETERVIGALRPRLETSPGRAVNKPIPMKPAPVE